MLSSHVLTQFPPWGFALFPPKILARPTSYPPNNCMRDTPCVKEMLLETSHLDCCFDACLCCRYGSGYSHAYGSEGYHHYMRAHDPSYEAFYNEGPSVDERWRSTYPYVPTSYSQQCKDLTAIVQNNRNLLVITAYFSGINSI